MHDAKALPVPRWLLDNALPARSLRDTLLPDDQPAHRMEISDLICRLGGDCHSLRGVAFESHAPFREIQFRTQFALLRTDESMVVEGSVCPADEGAIAFELLVPFGAIQLRGATCDLRSPVTGLAAGRIVTNGQGFELLGRSSTGQLCSMHFEFTGPRSFSVSGMIEFRSHSIAFAGKDTKTWEEVQAAKVIGITKRI